MVASFVWLAAHFYSSPQIFAYSPFFGFLSGAIYDDVITISGTLLLYRLNNVAQAALVALVTAAALDPSGLRARLSVLRRAGGRRIGAIVAVLLAVATFFALRGRVGYEVSTADIQRELGGRIETASMIIYYPKDDPELAREIEWIAEDHAYRYERLAERFGRPHPTRIESYIYANSKQKRRLMGADKVYIAKPWLGQIHLHELSYGGRVLEHELVHVFAASYAPGPLHVTARFGILPHMALVEGLATAIEWDRGRLTPHQWSAAMDELGFLPKLDRIMGPDGYLNAYGGSAYTAAGSFVRWLMDERGLDRVLQLYGDGDFEVAFGKPMSVLVTEWTTFLRDRRRVPLAEEDLDRARFYFDRKGVLQRVCPLTIAGLERAAGEALAAGDAKRAVVLRQQILDYMPKDPGKKARLAGALLVAGEEERARELAREVLASEHTGNLLRASVREALADADWRAGDVATARAAYGELLRSPLDDGSLRSVQVKLLSIDSPIAKERDGVRAYLTKPMKDDEAVAHLMELVLQVPESGITAYLLGRRLFAMKRYGDALPLLRQAARLGTGAPIVEGELHRLLGLALYFTGEPAMARDHLARAVELQPVVAQGLRNGLLDWMDRCDWKQKAPKVQVAADGLRLAEPTLALLEPPRPCDCNGR
jgi:tetratricopeptide (TPR) repeat protein